MIRILSMVIRLSAAFLFAMSAATAHGKGAATHFRGWELPESVTFCGEPVPLKDRRVYEELDQQLIIAAGNEDRVKVWFRRAGRYFPHIEKRLSDMGLPSDLKYAAVSRTSLAPDRQPQSSPAGMWLLPEYVARNYGLRVDKEMDERLGFETSTEAALKHLKALHQAYGQWALALAAYIGGDGLIAEAVKEQEVRDFYRLDLPLAVEQQVFRLAAVKILMERPEQSGIAVDPRLAYLPLQKDKVPVNLNAPVRITLAAKALGIDYKAFKEFNPQLITDLLPKGRYDVWVPAGLEPRMKAFLNTVK